MIPGSGGTQRLARLVGLGRAKDVVMRRRRISAADALAWGLVSEVVPADELDASVERVIADLGSSRRSPSAMAKRVLNHVYDAPLSSGSSSRASRTAYSARPTTSPRASRRSGRSARPGSRTRNVDFGRARSS